MRLTIITILTIYKALCRTWTARSRKFWWTAEQTRWSRTSRTGRAPSTTADRAATPRWENNNFRTTAEKKLVSFWHPVAPLQVVKEIIKFLHAGQIQLVVNKQSGWVFFAFLGAFFLLLTAFTWKKRFVLFRAFCLTPWDVSQTEPKCNRTSKYLFLEVGRKYIHPLRIATEIDCQVKVTSGLCLFSSSFFWPFTVCQAWAQKSFLG